jgi:hypothetical protein
MPFLLDTAETMKMKMTGWGIQNSQCGKMQYIATGTGKTGKDEGAGACTSGHREKTL